MVGWLNAATGWPALSYLLMAAGLLISGAITLAAAGPTRERLVAQSVIMHPSSAD